MADAALADVAHILPAEPVHRPSPADCARQLRAAYDASTHDAGQRMLLRELMAHFRAWCLDRAMADPFAAIAERVVSRTTVTLADDVEDAPLHDLDVARAARRMSTSSGAETAARSLAPVTRAAG